MEIYILRHGKAEERSQNISSDSKRRLTEVGKRDLQHIAKSISNLDIKFDIIISSPLVRAKQTADIVLKHVKNKKKTITIWNELKPEIAVNETIKKLTTMKPISSVLLVGHEPHLTTLIGSLVSSDSNDIDISLKKGGFVHIRCSHEKSTISGSLLSILTPKQLKKICK